MNTGEVVVGNIGSEKRAKFGVVGAHVNLAARIQAVTVGGEVLISEATATALGASLKTDRTLTIQTKGVSAPLQLFSVTGLSAWTTWTCLGPIPTPAGPNACSP